MSKFYIKKTTLAIVLVLVLTILFAMFSVSIAGFSSNLFGVDYGDEITAEAATATSLGSINISYGTHTYYETGKTGMNTTKTNIIGTYSDGTTETASTTTDGGTGDTYGTVSGEAVGTVTKTYSITSILASLGYNEDYIKVAIDSGRLTYTVTFSSLILQAYGNKKNGDTAFNYSEYQRSMSVTGYSSISESIAQSSSNSTYGYDSNPTLGGSAVYADADDNYNIVIKQTVYSKVSLNGYYAESTATVSYGYTGTISFSFDEPDCEIGTSDQAGGTVGIVSDNTNSELTQSFYSGSDVSFANFSIPYDETITVTASANAGYYFAGWASEFDGAADFISSDTTSFTFVSRSCDYDDIVLYAIFIPIFGSYTYNGTSQGPSVKDYADDGLILSVSYDNTEGTATYSDSTAPKNAGDYTYVPAFSLGETEVYAEEFEFTIAKADMVLSYTTPKTVEYGSDVPTYYATTSTIYESAIEETGLVIDYTASIGGVECADLTNSTSVGVYTIAINSIESVNYDVTYPTNTTTITISQATIVATGEYLAYAYYGQSSADSILFSAINANNSDLSPVGTWSVVDSSLFNVASSNADVGTKTAQYQFILDTTDENYSNYKSSIVYQNIELTIYQSTPVIIDSDKAVVSDTLNTTIAYGSSAATAFANTNNSTVNVYQSAVAVAGTWSIVCEGIVVDERDIAASDLVYTEYSLVFTPTSDNYNAFSIDINLTVDKADVVIAQADWSLSYTYGQDIDAILENMNGSVSSDTAYTFTYTAYESGSDSIEIAGTWSAVNALLIYETDGQTYSFTFTPTSDNYNAKTVTYAVNVVKYVVTLQDISALELTYCDTLAAANLTSTAMYNEYNGEEIPGVYSWLNKVDGDTAIINTLLPTVAESGTYSIMFNPNSDNYSSVYGECDLTVLQNTSDNVIVYDDMKENNSSILDDTYALYQVASDAGTLTIYARTSASNLGSAGVITASSDDNTKIIVSSTTITTSTSSYIETTIKIVVQASSNDSGITTITLSQSGNNNYTAASDVEITIFTKIPETDTMSNLTGVYGQTVAYDAGLGSGASYDLVSSDSSIVAVSQVDDVYYLTYYKAGTANITVSHAGYVDPANYTTASVAFEKTVSVTISQAQLTVTVDDIEVIYGVTPVFTYVISAADLQFEDSADDFTVQSYSYTSESLYSVGKYDVYVTFITGNDNYELVAVTGELSIVAKTLVATIEDDWFYYGSDIPTIDITYSGWEYGESAASYSDFVAPTIVYGDLIANCDADSYTISLTGGSVSNYIFDVSDTANITVSPAIPTVTFDEIIKVDYSGIAAIVAANVLAANNDVAAPMGTLSYEFSDDNGATWSDYAIDAGSYNIRVTFTVGAEESNYASTTETFTAYLVISKIAPSLALTNNSSIYNGQASTISYTISGALDEVPTGTVALQFYNGTTWSSLVPTDAGSYDVSITYTAAAIDNYSATVVSIEDGLLIEKADVTLLLETKNETYSTTGTSAILVYANTATASDIFGYAMPAQTMIYEYSEDGLTWTTIAPSDAGSYAVRVTYTVTDTTSNYITTTIVFESAVVIAQYDLFSNISLEVFTTTYTGANVAPSGVVSGLAGGSTPTGYLAYQYQLVGDTELSTEAKVVGTYHIYVTYVSGSNDNYYSSSTLYVKEGVIIDEAEVTLNMNYYNFTYSGDQISISVTSSGTALGTVPVGTITYGYALADYTVSSENYATDLVWSTTRPSEAGTYFVMARYINVTGENYKTTLVVFTDRLVISKATPTLTLQTVTASYTGDPVEANTTTTSIAGDDLFGVTSCLYYYSSTGVWSSDAPSASGKYDVRIIYTPGDGDNNYTNADVYFSNAVIINNIAPVIYIDSNVSYVYSGAAFTVGDISITNTITVGDALGRFTVEFQLTGTSSWTTTQPTEAGTYNVRITYTAATVDNFATGIATFASALTIEKQVVEVTPVSSQFKAYDGSLIDGATILCDLPDLYEGNVWTGSAYATDAINVGSYPITIGDISAGDNYIVSFVEGIEYQIVEKELLLSFSTIDNVYNGSAKSVYVSVDANSVVSGDAIDISYQMSGDNINVGSFYVVVYLLEEGDYLNYTLPSENIMTYEITPATMTGNVFSDINATYDGLGHTIELAQLEEDAVVVYDTATTYISRGSYTITATVSKENYYDDVLTATLIISKADPVVSVSVVDAVYTYGDSLPDLIVSGIDGTATLDQGQTLAVGTKLYVWTFVPNDTNNYNTATGNVSITVEKANVSISISGAMSQTVSDPKNITVSVSGLNNEVAMSATVYYINDMTGEISTVKPVDAGTYTVKVVYAEDENYAETVVTSKLVIAGESSLTWLWIVLAVAVVLIVGSCVYFARRRSKM